MDEKYRLGNVLWFYNTDKHVLVPVLFNEDKTQVIDLKSNIVYKSFKEPYTLDSLKEKLAQVYNCQNLETMRSANIINICFNRYSVYEIAKYHDDYNYGRPSKETIENASYSIKKIKKLHMMIEKKFYDKMKERESYNHLYNEK